MKHPILIMLILFALPALLLAQADTTGSMEDDGSTPGMWTAVASGGWTFPSEPPEFGDQFKTNFNVGVGIAYSLSPGEVGYGEVSYLLHYYSVLFTRSGFRAANNIKPSSGIYGNTGHVFTAMIQFRGVYGSPGGGIAPFFTTAIGVYHIALPERGLMPSTVLYPETDKTTFGWSVGLGVDIPVMERYTLFLDGKFLIGVSGASGYRQYSGGGGVRVRL